MQLSPLQSRLAASLVASCLVIVLYLFLFAPQFAFASDLIEIPRSLDYDDLLDDIADNIASLDERGPLYEPEFSLFDRSIIGRVSDGASSLEVDNPTRFNIDPESTLTYVFEVASISGRSSQEPDTPSYGSRRSLEEAQEVAEGGGHDVLGPDSDPVERRAPSKTLYISVNTCNQPVRISPDQTTVDPPQLTLFVSTSAENTSPGPAKDQDTQKMLVFDEGAVMFNTTLDRDVYFSISAPKVSDDLFTTALPYNYEVALSLDGYYHSYDSSDQPNLYWVDSDASSALLKTQNLTSRSEEVVSTPPYMVFIQNTNNLDLHGIRKSYCGLSNWAQIRPLQDGNSQATIGLRRGAADLTVQEFYISGLNASANYTGIVALNTSLGLQKRQQGGSEGGVVVYDGVPFSTKPNGACTFIFNLTLCTQTQYAVPGNSARFPNGTALAAFYDNYTRTMWDNFEKVLQQTPCQAPPIQKYSLVRDCDDCKQAYKDWLCSVAVPRCEDFSSPDQTYLHMRNINAPFPNGSFVDEEIRSSRGNNTAFNSSRNVEIDTTVQPGPYKEVLPCDYLCYELVRSCPASIGFSCPLPKSIYSFSPSYATLDTTKELSCNYPGSAYLPSAASSLAVSWVLVAIPVLFLLL
ncbi:stretch-activated Ca2+-permeable channel component-domain-containing protein [Nemania sp. NC0429]|nr:stretch-activated Ca2+-permeable channel component-domain-containing protein [Nemania sp. NC0429]